MMNVIVRTHRRELAFKRCIESINRQTYHPIRIIVVNDGEDEYCKSWNPVINQLQSDGLAEQWEGHRLFTPNQHLDHALKFVLPGMVMILDDDDFIVSRTAVEQIMKFDGKFVRWLVYLNGATYPRRGANSPPVSGDTSMIGFSWPSSFHPTFGSYKRGDYRAADQIYHHFGKVYGIDQVLTSGQRDPSHGYGVREDFVEYQANIWIAHDPDRAYGASWRPLQQDDAFRHAARQEVFAMMKKMRAGRGV